MWLEAPLPIQRWLPGSRAAERRPSPFPSRRWPPTTADTEPAPARTEIALVEPAHIQRCGRDPTIGDLEKGGRDGDDHGPPLSLPVDEEAHALVTRRRAANSPRAAAERAPHVCRTVDPRQALDSPGQATVDGGRKTHAVRVAGNVGRLRARSVTDVLPIDDRRCVATPPCLASPHRRKHRQHWSLSSSLSASLVVRVRLIPPAGCRILRPRRRLYPRLCQTGTSEVGAGFEVGRCRAAGD